MVYPSSWTATQNSKTEDVITIGVIEEADEVDEAVEEVETEVMEVVDNELTTKPRTSHIVLCAET